MHDWINRPNISFPNEDDIICKVCGIKGFRSYDGDNLIIYYICFKGLTQYQYSQLTCEEVIIKNIID